MGLSETNKESISPLAQKMGLLLDFMGERDGLWIVSESMSWKANCLYYFGLLMTHSARSARECVR